nr:cuticle collagen 2-like [Penaeus vannamei]
MSGLCNISYPLHVHKPEETKIGAQQRVTDTLIPVAISRILQVRLERQGPDSLQETPTDGSTEQEAAAAHQSAGSGEAVASAPRESQAYDRGRAAHSLSLNEAMQNKEEKSPAPSPGEEGQPPRPPTAPPAPSCDPGGVSGSCSRVTSFLVEDILDPGKFRRRQEAPPEGEEGEARGLGEEETQDGSAPLGSPRRAGGGEPSSPPSRDWAASSAGSSSPRVLGARGTAGIARPFGVPSE